MRKLRLIMLSVLSLSLLAEEEFHEVIEGVIETQYEEIGVVSEPTIMESSSLDEMSVVKFESEIKKEQSDTKTVENLVEENLSKEEESVNPIFTTFDNALKIAKEENKIVLLDVVANSCPFCEKMEKEVLTTDRVQEVIKKDFVLAQVNEDREPLPLGLSPQMTPMIVFITKTETVEDMRFGFIKKDDFLELLEKEREKLDK